MSLEMPFVGSRFKLLRMSWYRNMKFLYNNLKLGMKKNLCGIHATFNYVDTNDNYLMLGGMSNSF